MLEPVGLRISNGKVLLLGLTCLPYELHGVVDLGRGWIASLQGWKSQWCEGRPPVDLKSRYGSPSVVHSEICHYPWMRLVSAVITVDGDCLELFALQLVRTSILSLALWMLTWTDRCLRLVPR